MKVSDVIKELQQELEKHGDFDVVVYADHGQAQMYYQGASLQEVEEDPERSVIEIYGDGYYE